VSGDVRTLALEVRRRRDRELRDALARAEAAEARVAAVEKMRRGLGLCEQIERRGGRDQSADLIAAFDADLRAALATDQPDPALLDRLDQQSDHLTVTIPAPTISTGPAGKTVIEAAVDYLRDAAGRVESNRYWGSGVSALVARTLRDVADAAAHTYVDAGHGDEVPVVT
jgi:hypothetical protein